MKLIRLSQSTNKLIEEHRLKKQLKQILLLLKKQKLSRFAKRKLKLAKELTLIFVSPIEQKKLNYKFRKKK